MANGFFRDCVTHIKTGKIYKLMRWWLRLNTIQQLWFSFVSLCTNGELLFIPKLYELTISIDINIPFHSAA